MALIKTIEEVKKYADISKSVSFSTLVPDFNEVEEKYIQKHLSDALYLDLVGKYNAGTLSAIEAKLHSIAQNVITNIGLGLNVDIKQISYSDSGLQRREDAESKTAYQYQKNDLQRYFLTRGYNAIETMLEYLENNTATFTTWVNSPAYTISKTLLINSATEFSKHYDIKNSRRTFLSLQHIISNVETFEIEDVISTDLFDEIKGQILSGTLSEDNTILLDKYVNKALAYLSISKALTEFVVNIDHSGIYISESNSAQSSKAEKKTPPDHLREAKKHDTYRTGMAYLDKAAEFLNKKASEIKYAAYFNSEKYEAPIIITTENPDSKLYGAH